MPHRTAAADRDSPRGRRARARALAALYLAGAALALAGVALPGWDDARHTAILGLVAAALVIAAALYLLADRVTTGWCHLVVTVSYLAVALGQVLAGGGTGTATYAMLYAWTALYAALFFEPRAIVAHVGASGVANLAALGWLGTLVTELATVLITLGTQATAAVIVYRLISKLREQAETDALTGLGNRLVFDHALRQALAVAARDPSRPVCVAVLDLDDFKAYNDAAGHPAGDQLLAQTATGWRALTRETDTLARAGGDEFLLVLVDTGCDDARHTVQRLIDAVPEGVGCSAGLAQWNGFESAELLLDRADRALYRAKESGPVQVDAGHPDVASTGR